MPALVRTIILEDARTILNAAVDMAHSLDVRATILVLDLGGDIVLALRMDGSWPGAFDLALAKARAARAFAASSGTFTALVQPGASLFGVNGVAAGRYLPLPGGEPVLIDDMVLGSVGIGGGTPSQDEAIARAGVASIMPK